MSGKREVRAVGSIRNPFLVFKLQTRVAKIPSLIVKNYDSFRFSKFWLLFLNQSRVNLVSRKT
ncbi:hypothetical protein FORC37_p049 (plasmid) [Vibrio vulnificus]|nr:hypothetical protein FORC37_p049 [Vibrio vulnificus]